MGHKTIPHHRPTAGQNLENTLGHSGLSSELPEPHGGEWGPFRGLHNDRISRGKRWCKTPGCNGHGKVPRRDNSHDSEGLVKSNVDSAGNRNLLTHQTLGCRGVVLKNTSHMIGFPAGLGQRVARVADLQRCEVLYITCDGVSKMTKNLGALCRGKTCPTPLRRLRQRDGVIGLLQSAGLDRFHRLGGGWIHKLVAHWVFSR